MAKSQIVIPLKHQSFSDTPSYVLIAYVLLFALCIPLFFVGLGHPPLLDPDEPVYAATGRTMLQSGNFASWWSPHYDGALWFDKPPMTYWLIGLSMTVFGQTPFAARFPSAFCALLLVFFTACLTQRMWPRSSFAGVWAGVAIASAFQTIILSRAAVTDMILTALLSGALIGVWNWLADERQTRWLYVSGLATGLATLTKGPVAIVLVGGSILFFLLFSRQLVKLRSPALWVSLSLSIIVALPWYISMIYLHGNLFVQGFLEANNLTRYLSAEHPKTSSPFWFFPVLLGFIFPWTIPMLLAIKNGWGSIRSGDRGALFAIVWIVWIFLFFSASQTKLLTYIYPLYPMAAVLIGIWIDNGTTRAERSVSGVVFASVAFAVAIMLPTYVSHGQGLSGAKVVLDQTGLVFAIAALLSLISLASPFERSKISRQLVFAIPALCMAVFFALVALAPYWKTDLPNISMVNLAGVIKSHSTPDELTVAISLKKPSLVYYSSRRVIFTDDRKEAAGLMLTKPYPLCVIKSVPNEDVVSEIEKFIPAGHCKIVLHSGLNYVLIKYQP